MQNNIADLLEHCKATKAEILKERERRVPMAKRKLHYVLFIDFEKAFDRVNRALLL